MDTNDRFSLLRDLYEKVVELPESERRAYLQQACKGDDALRRDVEELLAADEQVGDFLATPAVTWVGKTIDHYTVKSIIAEGGMGILLRAEQSEPRRDVALKLIRRDIISDSMLRRFKLEAEVLGRLDHPGIAQIFDAATTKTGRGEQPYFAMELIDGETLTDYAAHHALKPRERVELMSRVCDAVHHAHQKGVIHRDLKPANILVRPDGQPKVVDFGVARITNSDLQATTMHTEIGQVIGTLPYMSPEQVGGRQDDLDTSSDIYALGVVCYELLTGELPYELKGRSLPEAARIITDEDAKTLTSVGSRHPADLETIVGKCLEKDRDRRYGSAGELADDLRRFLNDEPIAARPSSAVYQFRKFARRNRRLVAVGCIALGILVAGLVVSTAGWSTAVRERQRARLEADKANVLVDFLVDMISAPNPWNSGKEVRVVDVLDAASESIDERFANQPEVAAAAHRTMGSTYREIGDQTKAMMHTSRGLELSRSSLLDTDDPRLLGDLNNVGRLKLDGYELDDAARIAEDIKLVMERSDPDSKDFMTACLFLGSVYRAREQFVEAREQLLPCLEHAREMLEPADTQRLSLEIETARIDVVEGDPARAKASMERLLAQLQAEYGMNHPSIGHIFDLLARIDQDLGDHDQALQKYEMLLGMIRQIYGDEFWPTAYCLDNLAKQLRVMGRPQDALPHHEEGLRVLRKILPADDVRIQLSEYGYGITLVEVGRYDEAEPMLLGNYDVLSGRFGPKHLHSRTVAGALSDLYKARGDAASAEQFAALAK